jgi:2-keto-3-deoxy-L-rhamnonate aldolase RhmA
MSVIANKAKQQLRAHEAVLIYIALQTRDCSAGFVAASCGYDILLIDLEHGTTSLSDAASISMAALAQGVCPMVRVGLADMTDGTRLLQNGAMGLMVPDLRTADDARRVVEAGLYPPLGTRGAGPMPPQLGGGSMPWQDAMPLLNRETLLIGMIEHPLGVQNAREIASVEGIDALLIGALDLTIALGVPGKFDDDRVVGAMDTIGRAAGECGKAWGFGGLPDDSLTRRYIDNGATLLIGGTDSSFIRAGAATRATELRRLAMR